MALKIKAREKKLKFSQDGPEVWRYVMQPDLYSTLDSEKVIKEAAIRSGVSEGVMQACWKGAGEVIKAWATEGGGAFCCSPRTRKHAFRTEREGCG